MTVPSSVEVEAAEQPSTDVRGYFVKFLAFPFMSLVTQPPNVVEKSAESSAALKEIGDSLFGRKVAQTASCQQYALATCNPHNCGFLDLPVGIIARCAGRRGVARLLELCLSTRDALCKVNDSGIASCSETLDAFSTVGIYVSSRKASFSSESMFHIDVGQGTSSCLPLTCTQRRGSASVRLGGKLYVVGGVDNPPKDGPGAKQSCFECFDPVLNCWEPMPSFGERDFDFSHAAIACADGSIYVFGGLSGGQVLDQSIRFDFRGRVWEELLPMRTPRFECSATAVKDRIYVLGGANVNGDPLAEAEFFDLSTLAWKALPPMCASRYGSTSLAIRSGICVLGGRGAHGALADVEFFEPRVGHWERLAPLPAPRCYCGAVMFGGKVLVFGGISDTKRCLSQHGEEGDDFAPPAAILDLSEGVGAVFQDMNDVRDDALRALATKLPSGRCCVSVSMS